MINYENFKALRETGFALVFHEPFNEPVSLGEFMFLSDMALRHQEDEVVAYGYIDVFYKELVKSAKLSNWEERYQAELEVNEQDLKKLEKNPSATNHRKQQADKIYLESSITTRKRL